jgi:RNA polymerase sigma factor (sigma-70 family)
MIRRETLIEQFSTFILWNENNRFNSWRSDPRLQRNMSKQLEQHPTFNVHQWIAFWQNRWQDSIARDLTVPSQLSKAHLYAYLQEPCHQVALNIWQTHQNYSKEYTVPDYFHFGVLKFDKLILDFNPKLNPDLGKYAFHLLKWRITDTLRERHKTWGYTTWSLLLHRSKTCVKNALTRYGISGDLLENCLLAWECYVETYKTTKNKRDGSIQQPTDDDWLKIVVAYNSVSDLQKDIVELKTWISYCCKAVSIYISLPSTSGSTPIEDGNKDLESSLKDESQLESLELDGHISTDYQQLHQKICSWLETELERLDIAKARLNPNVKQMLELYYRQGIKQTDIAQQLGINQATVARNLHKIKELLTNQFLKWNLDNLDISLKSNDIKLTSKALETWMQYYYNQTNSKAREI